MKKKVIRLSPADAMNLLNQNTKGINRKIDKQKVKNFEKQIKKGAFLKDVRKQIDKERVRLAMVCVKSYCDNIHLFRKGHNPINTMKSFGRSFKITKEEIEAVKKMTVGEIIEIFSKK